MVVGPNDSLTNRISEYLGRDLAHRGAIIPERRPDRFEKRDVFQAIDDGRQFAKAKLRQQLRKQNSESFTVISSFEWNYDEHFEEWVNRGNKVNIVLLSISDCPSILGRFMREHWPIDPQRQQQEIKLYTDGRERVGKFISKNYVVSVIDVDGAFKAGRYADLNSGNVFPLAYRSVDGDVRYFCSDSDRAERKSDFQTRWGIHKSALGFFGEPAFESH